MLEDSYLCEANIEAAQIMIDKEGKKSEQIKNTFMSAIYWGFATMYPYSIKNYWEILFNTHGGC